MSTKLIITTLTVLLGSAVFVSAQKQSTVWSAESYPDITEISGNPRPVQTPLGTAVEFNGKDDGLFTEQIPVKGMDELTIEVIFKPYGNSNFEQRFLHIGTPGGPRILFEERMKPDNTWYFDAFVRLGAAGPAKALIDPALTHPAGRWYNLTFELGRKGIKSFVDGVEQCSDTLSYRPAIVEGGTSIGVRMDKRNWFNGAIFKVRITGRLLRPDEFLDDQKKLNGDSAAAPASFSLAPRYKDPSLSPQERADDLLKRLTLEQKVSLMMNTSQAIPDLGIREYNWWSEALHGCARAGTATVFPQAIGMASSWDEALLKQVFTIAGDEQRIKFKQARREGDVRRYYGLTVWTPNINIFRDPRWGRGQETYGEDPYLTSRMGAAVVNGLQGKSDGRYDKIHACLKHYAVHSGPEGLRHKFDVSGLSYRDLMETYLYAFENIIKTTDVQEVMCAYNAVDGKPCCGNDQLLVQLLRNKWGYKGMVVSDCGAIDDFYRTGAHETFNDAASAVANAVRTGTDVECGSSYKHLLEAVEQGKITEKDIDISVRRLLVARFRLGEMDADSLVSWNNIPESALACDESRKVALKMAHESMVLLRNDGILPLAKKGVRYAVIGPNAADSVVLNGNYNGTPRSSVTALKGIISKVGAGNITGNAAEADVVIYVGGISPRYEGEEMRYDKAVEGFDKGDRTTIEFPKDQRAEIAALHKSGKRIVLVNMSGSAVAMLPETENCDAILQAWYSGEAGGTAIADVLFGDYNPAGRLPVTFYRSDSDLPDFNSYDMADRTYRYFKGQPLWEFGYGLSYTTFKYGRPRFSNGNLTVSVKNTGKMDGDEVVQVYVKKDEDVNGPKMALRGFRRVHIKAGQSVKVTIPLDVNAFKTYDEASGEMAATPGHFTVYCGPSSDLNRLRSISIIRK